MSATTIDPTAARLQFTTGERPGGAEEPGSRRPLWAPVRLPDRTSIGRLLRLLTEPREGIRHSDFFAPYGRPRIERPRPWC